MRTAWLGLFGMLCAVAFGITGAIWVGLHLGGWGLAVITGLALGIPVAVLLLSARPRPAVWVGEPVTAPWVERDPAPGITSGAPWAAPANGWGMAPPRPGALRASLPNDPLDLLDRLDARAARAGAPPRGMAPSAPSGAPDLHGDRRGWGGVKLLGRPPEGPPQRFSSPERCATLRRARRKWREASRQAKRRWGILRRRSRATVAGGCLLRRDLLLFPPTSSCE
jgi:hypothetical protein